MKITIYSRGKLAFNPFTEKNVGVGSTETTIINLASRLSKLGHDVTVYCNCNFPDIYNDVRYYKHYDYRESDEDVLIGFGMLPKNINATKVFLWETKVEPDHLINFTEAWRIKNLIVSSAWHRDRLASEIPSTLVSKMEVIEPGVHEDFFNYEKVKEPLSVAFAGAVQKGGMEALIEYAKRVKPKNKDIMIRAYGGASMWGGEDEQFRPLFDKLIKSKIFYHGQKGKKRMVRHMGGAFIFINPVKKHYQQAFGLTVLEAMASGCVVIANDNGNVKNLVKDAGFIINENIDDYKFAIEAADITFKLFDNPSLMMEMSQKAKNYAKEYTWDKTVERFLRLI